MGKSCLAKRVKVAWLFQLNEETNICQYQKFAIKRTTKTTYKISVLQNIILVCFDIVLLWIIVDGLGIDFTVRKAVAAAFLYPIEDIGHAILYVLVRLVVICCKQFVLRCTVVQIGLDCTLEMVCCLVHIVRF